MIYTPPSILAADFSRLGEQVLETERAGTQRIHVDVMDGHFVPNLSMGPVVVKGLRPRTKLPLEVHLMVENPAMFIEAFCKAGADTLIVHHEVLSDPRPVFEEIRARGKRVGFAINPDTPVDAIKPHLRDIDLALCMTVHPGFGSQAFIPESVERIARLHQLIQEQQARCELEVDGGIEDHTAPSCVRAGATVLVVGTGIFGKPGGPAPAGRGFAPLAPRPPSTGMPSS